jgi:type I restriction enzyme M protein
MYLHGLHAPQISEYDTLTSEDNWNEYADVILANPPFMSPKGGIRPHKRFSVSSNRSEVLFVDYIAEHLTPNGRAAVIVPEGIIFQSGNAYKNLRKMLVEKFLVGVISLPAGVFHPYSGVKTSILWLDRTLAKKTDKILFVKIENDGFDLGAQRRPIKQNDLPNASNKISNYRNKLYNESSLDFTNDPSITIYSKNLISVNGEFNLSSERYIVKDLRTSKFPVTSLGEVVEIIMGQAPPGNDCNKENIGTPFVKVGNFGKVQPRIEEWTTNPLKMAYPKDTLICVVGATIGKINRGIDCAIGRSVAAVRPDENKINPTFLYCNLVEWTEKLRKKSQGSAIGVITKEMLYEIDIPLPSLSVQEEIVAEIEEYNRQIEEYKIIIAEKEQKIKDRIAKVWGA